MASPVLDVVMRLDVMLRPDFDVVRIRYRALALVLLRSAHRPHCQFETLGLLDLRCCGKRWNHESNGDQTRGAVKRHVHDEIPQRRIASC
jgi:hypothetical protein